MDNKPPSDETTAPVLAQKEAELKDLWSSDSNLQLEQYQIEEGLKLFRKLSLEYLSVGMSLKLATLAADIAAVARVTQPKKVIAICEKKGMTNGNPKASAIIAYIERELRMRGCALIGFAVGKEMGFDDVNGRDLQRAFADGVTYETASVLAFRYFQQFK